MSKKSAEHPLDELVRSISSFLAKNGRSLSDADRRELLRWHRKLLKVRRGKTVDMANIGLAIVEFLKWLTRFMRDNH